MKAPKNILSMVMTGQLLAATLGNAQPVLTFSRIVNNWPTIRLHFKVACDGQVTQAFTKNNFEVRENGIQVPNFDISCYPDPCPISVALVMDASGSMAGAGNAGAKAAGNAFVEMMDGVVDQAAIVWFASVAHVELGMTTNKTDLHDAVNSLPASDATAVWDGIWLGLNEVIIDGSNPCRAVIALTDGADNSSSRTPDEIIALANRNNIRVFTIGLGAVSPAPLETISLLTGGKYYVAPNASRLVEIFQEINQTLKSGEGSCFLTYDAQCPDGGYRAVELRLKNFCNGGSDSKTRTYQATKDTSVWTAMDIYLGSALSSKGSAVNIPLTMNAPISGPTVLYPSVFTVLFDNGCMSFNMLETPPGTLLNGVPASISAINGGIEVRVEDYVIITQSGTLGYLSFTPSVNPADSLECPLDLATWSFEAGCFRPILHDGSVKVFNSDIPFVVVEGMHSVCEGDSVRLTAADGFTDYLWSTGATTRSIWVKTTGSYSVTAKNGAGHTATSNTVTITVIPVPIPYLFPRGTIALCHGAPVTIMAEKGYEEYIWTTGDTTQEITVTGPGSYSFRARTSTGCWAESERLQIYTKGPEPNVQGDFVLCGQGGIGEYSVPANAGFEFEWQISGGTMLTPADSNAVRVLFSASTASVSVEVYDPATACRVTDTKQVMIYEGPQRVLVSQGPIFCNGDSADLFIEPIYTSYKWNTGSTESFIRPTETGDYYCEVTNGPCTFYTDTVHITRMDDLQMTITGDDVVCQNTTATYSAPMIDGLNYYWRLEGESPDNGSGNPVTLHFGGGQTAKVVLRYGPAWCPDSISFDVTLKEAMQPDVLVMPGTKVCIGDSVTLEAEAGFTDYRWSNGATGQTIVVTQPGMYHVTAIGPNGCRGQSDVSTVEFTPAPGTPSISAHGDTLTCDQPGFVYEWYLNGSLIPGETGRSLIVQTPGSYTVRIYNGTCYSESAPYTTVGIGSYVPGLARTFDVSPNPASGKFQVALEFEQPTAFRIQLVNITGQVVYSHSVQEQVVSFRETISLDGALPGAYFLMIHSQGSYDFQKIIVRGR